MLTAIIVILSVVVYANIGFVVGLHIHKTVATLEDSPASLMGAIFWPVLLGYLKNQRKKELEAKRAAKALPPAESDPFKKAGELRLLQEKKAELDEEIRQLEADPDVQKMLNFPKRF